jgi:LuxR family maltose regulon positive regulatory protein
LHLSHALAAQECSQADSVRRHLEAALGLARSEGYVLPFHELGDRGRTLLDKYLPTAGRFEQTVVALVRSWPEDAVPLGSGGPAPTVEPLTPRERDVLDYLSSRFTAADIGQALNISLNTVKVHQRAIYRKLGVTTRRRAVERAQVLRLL